LGLPNDPFTGQSLLIGLFAKAFYQVAGQRPVDPDFDRRRDKQQYELRVKRLDIEFDRRLRKLFDTATEKGLWIGASPARNPADSWPTAITAYFDATGPGQAPDGAVRPITTREMLKAYDPELFALVDETMAYGGHVDWRWRR